MILYASNWVVWDGMAVHGKDKKLQFASLILDLY